MTWKCYSFLISQAILKVSLYNAGLEKGPENLSKGAPKLSTDF